MTADVVCWSAELFRERIRMLKAVKRLSLLHAMAGPAHVTGYLDAESLSRLEGDDLLNMVLVFPEHRFAFALDPRQNLMALPSGDRGMPHWTGPPMHMHYFHLPRSLAPP